MTDCIKVVQTYSPCWYRILEDSGPSKYPLIFEADTTYYTIECVLQKDWNATVLDVEYIGGFANYYIQFKSEQDAMAFSLKYE